MTAPFDFTPPIARSEYNDEPIDGIGDKAAANYATESSDPTSAPPYAKTMLSLTDERRVVLTNWLDQWIRDLVNMGQSKDEEFAEIETAYRALPDPPRNEPFVGANTDNIPIIASGVDPVHARLDIGVFKQDPPIRIAPVRKFTAKYTKALEKFVNVYYKNVIDLRKISGPRMLELAKLGTMVFKTTYERDIRRYKKYARDGTIVTVERQHFAGPRVTGVPLGDFLFPPGYESLENVPIVIERQRTRLPLLRAMEKDGWLTNVSKLDGHTGYSRTTTELAREDASNHEALATSATDDEITVFECWFHYDYDGDGQEECLTATFHPDSQTLLQLRLNPYDHGMFPYDVAPYTVTNGSLYGLGVGHMMLQIQRSVSKWQQIATDNGYLANARMLGVKKGTPGIEEKPKIYAGRTFFLENPSTDIVSIQMGEIYPSTLQERQNLIGIGEKRSGISDYLTGRESPILGSRATATSTMALIQEGTKRVESVMENVRGCYAGITTKCFAIWTQYGLNDMDEYLFGDDEDTGPLVKEFFSTVAPQQVIPGSFSVSIGVSDAMSNRQVQQQMQLALIGTMSGYLEKTISLGQLALQSQQIPGAVPFITEVYKAGSQMFRDLLDKYDIPNAEAYLPDVLQFFNQMAPTGPQSNGPPGAPPSAPGSQDPSGMADLLRMAGRTDGQPPPSTGEPQSNQ